MKILKHLPNFLTLMNLFCGCIAIGFLFKGNLHTAAFLIIAGALFDFADGNVARLLKAQSPIGKDLDSLADMVTFGVAPGAILFFLLLMSYTGAGDIPTLYDTWDDRLFLLSAPAFILPLFSALRLAKFNNDTRQTNSFIGLPTPAVAIFVIALPLSLYYQAFQYQEIILSPIFLYSIVIILSALMVSEIPMFGIKSLSASADKKLWIYFILTASVIAIIFLKFAGIAIAILIYILTNIVYALTHKRS